MSCERGTKTAEIFEYAREWNLSNAVFWVILPTRKPLL